MGYTLGSRTAGKVLPMTSSGFSSFAGSFSGFVNREKGLDEETQRAMEELAKKQAENTYIREHEKKTREKLKHLLPLVGIYYSIAGVVSLSFPMATMARRVRIICLIIIILGFVSSTCLVRNRVDTDLSPSVSVSASLIMMIMFTILDVILTITSNENLAVLLDELKVEDCFETGDENITSIDCTYEYKTDLIILLLKLCNILMVMHATKLQKPVLFCCGIVLINYIWTTNFSSESEYKSTAARVQIGMLSAFGLYTMMCWWHLRDVETGNIKSFNHAVLSKHAVKQTKRLRASMHRHIANEKRLEEAIKLQSMGENFNNVKMTSPLLSLLQQLQQLEETETKAGNVDIANTIKAVIKKLQENNGEDLKSIDITETVRKSEITLDDDTKNWLKQNTREWNQKRKDCRQERAQTIAQFNNKPIIRSLSAQYHVGKRADHQLLLVDSWNEFDAFEYTNDAKAPLSTLMERMFHVTEIWTKLNINKKRFLQYFDFIGQHYCYVNDGNVSRISPFENPYHNTIHAVDVVQSVFCFLRKGKPFQTISTHDTLALLWAAAIHDFQHPGRTSQFLIDKGHTIAIQHNDQSALERFHLSEAFKALYNEEHNFVSEMTRKQQLEVRHTVVDLVLATDLASTTRYLSSFQLFLQSQNEISSAVETAQKVDENQLLLLEIALKVADIGHPAKPNFLHREWSNRIREEFFSQGDEQRRMGVPVDPLCDRYNSNMNKSQIGFIEFICRPLVKPFAEFVEMPELNTNLINNYNYWRENEGL